MPPQKLLVIDITEGRGWEPICTFLNLPIPEVPFPRVNDTAEFQGMVTKINIVGWTLGILGLGIPFLFMPDYKD